MKNLLSFLFNATTVVGCYSLLSSGYNISEIECEIW